MTIALALTRVLLQESVPREPKVRAELVGAERLTVGAERLAFCVGCVAVTDHVEHLCLRPVLRRVVGH
eukprot:COSAG01_NODE_57607_length_311_cov_0.731132_1_plen_67_part_01